MNKVKYGFAILANLTLVLHANSSTDWDHPEDIPNIEPVTVGLAGEQPAEIVRYLMARGAFQASLSQIGRAHV